MIKKKIKDTKISVMKKLTKVKVVYTLVYLYLHINGYNYLRPAATKVVESVFV